MNKIILKVLRYFPEKWLLKSIKEWEKDLQNQVINGEYPEGTYLYELFRLRKAWIDLLIEICIALGSDIQEIEKDNKFVYHDQKGENE